MQPAKGRRIVAGDLGAAVRAPDPARLRHILSREIHHHHAAIGRHLLQHCVRHVARRVAQRPRIGVGEDHRRLRHAQRVQHRRLADMAEVHQHAQAIEFMHHRLAKGGEAVMLRIVRRAVGPADGAAVRQRQIGCSEPPIGAQHRQAAVDLPAALDPDQRPDPPGPVRGAHVSGGPRDLEMLRIAGGQAVDHADLVQRVLDLLHLRQVGRHPDGPELPAHAPGMQPRDVGMIGRRVQPRQVHRPARVLRLFRQRLGPVIMPVDQRRGLQDLRDARGIGPGGGRIGGMESGGGEQQRHQRQGQHLHGCAG